MAGKNIIAYSVWGDDPVYLRGAISNLVMRARYYPDWECRFYLDTTSTPQIAKLAQEIVQRGGSIAVADPKGPGRRVGLYWRLKALLDEGVDHVLFRDTDSRPSDREAVCVFEWLDSDMPVHVIRDHRSHTAPLMGGLWGCVPAAVRDLVPDLKERLDERLEYVQTTPMAQSKPRVGHLPFSDQEFLADVIWPAVKDYTYAHDESKARGWGGNPFTVPMLHPTQFCGQAYSVQGVPKWPV